MSSPADVETRAGAAYLGEGGDFLEGRISSDVVDSHSTIGVPNHVIGELWDLAF